MHYHKKHSEVPNKYPELINVLINVLINKFSIFSHPLDLIVEILQLL